MKHLLLLILFIPLLYNIGNCQSIASGEERKLDVMMLYHFNQDLAPLGPVDNDACYASLVETLLKHPDVPFNIQISGTLMNNLTWFDKSAMGLLQKGVNSNQFEMWGSTYSQNIMYATDNEWVNSQQIKTHKNLLGQYFGSKPISFWNPERVWTQSFVSLLDNHGYKFVPIEQHILSKSGFPDDSLHFIREIEHNENSIYVIPDNTTFLNLIDSAVNSGYYTKLIDYLKDLHQKDSSDAFVLAYMQDAEATGCWQFEGGGSTEKVFNNLDSLLTVLKNLEWINITTPKRLLENSNVKAFPAKPIQDGQADWMIKFAKNIGYKDWFDYLENNEIQQYYKPIFRQVQDSLKQSRQLLAASPENEAAQKLFRRATRTYLSHEYEFGAVWYWSLEDADFNLVRETLVSLLATKFALQPTNATFTKDINIDGVEEIVMVDENNMYVFSIFGGRLLYWFDLKKGVSLIGNENFIYYGEKYKNSNQYVPKLKGGEDVYYWLKEKKVDVSKMPSDIYNWTFEIRRKALNDWVYKGGKLQDSLVNTVYEYTINDNGIVFNYVADGFSIEKRVKSNNDALAVSYTISNTSSEKSNFRFISENAFSPDYITIMDNGPESLSYLQANEQTGVKNTISGTGVFYEFKNQPYDLLKENVVFGLEVSPVYEFSLKKGKAWNAAYKMEKLDK